MTEQNRTYNADYEKERIKILHEECKLQVNDFYEQGIITPIYSDSSFINWDSDIKKTITYKFKTFQYLILELNKQLACAPITSLTLAGYVGFVLAFLIK